MKLSDIINLESATLEQAQAVNTTLHKLFNKILGLRVKCIVDPEYSDKDALGDLYDLVRLMNTESRYLVEDILEEMEEADNA